MDALSNDLNTHGALTELRNLFKAADFSGLKASAQLIGLLTPEMVGWALPPITGNASGVLDLGGSAHAKLAETLASFTHRLETLKAKAKEMRDFSAVDAMKKALTDTGLVIREHKTGVELQTGKTFDSSKLEALK